MAVALWFMCTSTAVAPRLRCDGGITTGPNRLRFYTSEVPSLRILTPQPTWSLYFLTCRHYLLQPIPRVGSKTNTTLIISTTIRTSLLVPRWSMAGPANQVRYLFLWRLHDVLIRRIEGNYLLSHTNLHS